MKFSLFCILLVFPFALSCGYGASEDEANNEAKREYQQKISFAHAFENGIDRYDKEYAKIILSFDDDVKAATNFLCNVATNILSVPKNVPVTIYIS